MDKKGQLNKLTGFALTIVIFTVVLAVGLNVLGELSDNLTADSYEANATDEILESMADIPGWIPVIIVAMIGGIVLFLVIRQFGGR